MLESTMDNLLIVSLLEENPERTLARDPYGQMGGYLKRLAGVKLYAKAENPPGQRIQESYVGDEPVVPGEHHQAAFVTEQGAPARYGAHREDTCIRAVAALEHTLARSASVEVGLTGWVVLV